MTPLEEAFWAKVEKRGPDECWPWLGGRHGRDGRGSFTFAGKRYIAPRPNRGMRSCSLATPVTTRLA
jgi:hypothetical protein